MAMAASRPEAEKAISYQNLFFDRLVGAAYCIHN
jgi:hypothetical protein